LEINQVLLGMFQSVKNFCVGRLAAKGSATVTGFGRKKFKT